MSQSEIKKFNEEVIKGLELAEYRMLRDKAMRNQIVITNFEDSGIREISARELFTRLYNEPVPKF